MADTTGESCNGAAAASSGAEADLFDCFCDRSELMLGSLSGASCAEDSLSECNTVSIEAAGMLV